MTNDTTVSPDTGPENIDEGSAQEIVLYKFANGDSPYLDSILGMFYQGALTNTIGIMQAWNTKEEKEETLLVGIAVDADGKPECYPIARALMAEDVSQYLSPDGMGGWFDHTNPQELAVAKQNMKSLLESVAEEVEEFVK